MMHPDTRVTWIDDFTGHGVFATAPLPAGTLLCVPDGLDQELTVEQWRSLPPPLRGRVEAHTWRNRAGRFYLSWDHAKYVNHCCHANTLITAWGVEIVVRDIAAGEQVTSDYALLNVIDSYPVACSKAGCRGRVDARDAIRVADACDAAITRALSRTPAVEQPLWSVLDPETRAQLEAFMAGRAEYPSVRQLRLVSEDASSDTNAVDIREEQAEPALS